MVKSRARAAVFIDTRLCKGTEGCNLCVHICPEQVLGASQNLSVRGVHPVAVLHTSRCTGCELCVIHCPDLAVWVAQKEAENGD